jgi:hypothetical protein
MRDFLADILAGIGWHQDTINDIFDEELYTGIVGGIFDLHLRLDFGMIH